MTSARGYGAASAWSGDTITGDVTTVSDDSGNADTLYGTEVAFVHVSGASPARFDNALRIPRSTTNRLHAG